tara:strand:- start:13406 stop:14341 length:936 start_codon:yes stop_codon:yes gene_type:complete
MVMRVGITGSYGFVGSKLYDFLKEKKIDVYRIYLNRSEKLFYIDSRDDLISTFSSTDTIIHCAGRVHKKRTNELSAYLEDNFSLSRLLASQAAEAGVKQFIFISTIKVNGEKTKDDEAFTNSSLPNPQDSYSVSKYLAELAIKEVSSKTSMDYLIIRPTLIYGPGVKANFLSLINFIYKDLPLPFQNIKNQRSLLFVDNLIDFIYNCLGNANINNKTLLLSDAYSISTFSLVEMLSESLNRKIKFIPFPLTILKRILSLIGKKEILSKLFGSLVVHSKDTYNELNWTPKYTTREGIEITCKWFLNYYKKAD